MSAHQIDYVAIIHNVKAGTTTREYFRAPHYQNAKALYAGRNADIVGVLPISTVRTGEIVTTLNPDGSVGEIGHVVSVRDNDPSILCFFE